MTDEIQKTDETLDKSSLMALYFKLLSDANNVLVLVNSPAAIQARIRIEEALLWGRMAIQSDTPVSN
jgi:hypothetical protein